MPKNWDELVNVLYKPVMVPFAPGAGEPGVYFVQGLALATGIANTTPVGWPSVKNRMAFSAPGWLSWTNWSYPVHKPMALLVDPAQLMPLMIVAMLGVAVSKVLASGKLT